MDQIITKRHLSVVIQLLSLWLSSTGKELNLLPSLAEKLPSYSLYQIVFRTIDLYTVFLLKILHVFYSLKVEPSISDHPDLLLTNKQLYIVVNMYVQTTVSWPRRDLIIALAFHAKRIPKTFSDISLCIMERLYDYMQFR